MTTKQATPKKPAAKKPAAKKPAAKKAAAKKPAAKKAATKKPASIDAYLATVTGERRVALDKLRATIRALIPRAEECISYAMPAFRLDGRVVAGFLATRDGCSYLPFSGTTLLTLQAELAAFKQTRGSLHFEPSRPLSRALVKKLIDARIAEER